MASLTVIAGPDRGRRFDLGAAAATLGRDARNSLRLHDTEASRQHAEVLPDGTGFALRDLGSSNGTFVNGRKVAAEALKHGDRIRVGQTEMLFADQVVSARDLAGKIDMIGRQPPGEESAILRSMAAEEGGAALLRPDQANSAWLRDALANLAVLYETSMAVSRIEDIGQLLDHLLALAFRSIPADRGCVMLKDATDGVLRPTAVRHAEGMEAAGPIAISTTIVDWVSTRLEGVIILDAGADARFQGAVSVARLGIREAICVPLRGRHDTLGVVYVDIQTDRKQVLTTQRPARFTDDHLKLMLAIANQAGLAIEDHRFHEAMVHAERLAAIGQTIATISHHVKNILQGMRSGSDLVEMGLGRGDDPLLRRGWQIVRRNQQRIFNMVMDMLTYSKEREPDLQPMDLNAVAADVGELLAARAAEAGTALTLDLAADLPTTAGDAEALHRAVMNLAGNALDAVEGRPGAAVAVATSHGGGRVTLTVCDNGPGVPPEQRERLFQAFVSTKGARGTGLGLPVTRKIAREHEGDVEVIDPPTGSGGCFRLWIPLREAPALPPPTRAELDLLLAGGGEG